MSIMRVDCVWSFFERVRSDTDLLITHVLVSEPVRAGDCSGKFLCVFVTV